MADNSQPSVALNVVASFNINYDAFKIQTGTIMSKKNLTSK